MNLLMQLCEKFKCAFLCIPMKVELVVIMNNKFKLLTVEADRTKRGIIGAQVCRGLLKYAQLSYPQISI